MSTRTKKANKKRKIKFFWMSMFFLMFILAGSLILQTGALAKQSARFSSVQQEVISLSDNYGPQHLVLADNFTNIEELAQSLNFEKINQVYYIRATENTALAK